MSNFRHFMIHKPYGMLSQFKLERQGVKRLLGELGAFPEGIMSIGRLDEKSEGLLLLTTNGKVSALINGQKVAKEYYAQLDGSITPEAIERLGKGVEISIHGKKFMTKPCETMMLDPIPEFKDRIRRIRSDAHGPTSWISITLKEGKFRQVRKMTAAVGFPTLRLVRVRIGNMVLGDMEAGGVKELDMFDLGL